MYRALLLLFLYFFSNFSFAQWQDCVSALQPDSNKFFVPRPKEGYGKIREFRQGNSPDIKSFPIERNVTWIQINIPEPAKLSFSICPQFESDDYDFMLFDGRAPDFCDSAINLRSLPILRSCISRNDTAYKACTGLSAKDSLERIPIGRGPSFASPASLIEGRYYVVVASNKRLKGGFFFEYVLEFPVKTLQDSLSIAFRKNIKAPKNTLYLSATDTLSGSVRKANWMVQTLSGTRDTIIDSLKTLVFPWSEKTLVTAMVPDFLPLSKLFEHDADSLSVTDTFILRRILPDSVLVLSFVFFEGNTDQILPESKPALEALLKFMQDNPRVKIEIQGHVNAPGRKNGRSLRKLSESRAFAIKKYLTFNGIKKNRVKTEGFGNEKMLFPNPQTPAESEQNRRVEVKITSVDAGDS